uniref:Retrovirus-related Pol polyprotein from transposon TNT 1-94 n=1 Tax=Cajanus cajan TaxID=3821 RepID=A0A151UEN4_CAJCA
MWNILKLSYQTQKNRGRDNYINEGRGNFRERGQGNYNNNFVSFNQGRGGNTFGVANHARGRGNNYQQRANFNCLYYGKFGHSMLKAKQMPREFSTEASIITIYILNRCPTKSIHDKTLEEAWSGRRPLIKHLKIFGCIAYAHVPDQLRKKSDDKGERYVFIGYNLNSKIYKRYNLETKKVIINKNVTFDEKDLWHWSPKSQKEKMVISNNYEEFEGQLDPVTDEPKSSNRPRRCCQLPTRLKDYVVGNDNDSSDEEIINFALFANYEPMTFEEASSDERWRKAMDNEIHVIKKNEMWELTNLLVDKRSNGVKWVYKTKYVTAQATRMRILSALAHGRTALFSGMANTIVKSHIG